MDIQGRHKDLDRLVMSAEPAESTHVRDALPTDPLPTDPPPTDSLAAVCRRFSTVELCLAWQQSFALQRGSHDPELGMRIARVRGAFLDEFERRDPDALAVWLGSGVPSQTAPTAFFAARPPDTGV